MSHWSTTLSSVKRENHNELISVTIFPLATGVLSIETVLMISVCGIFTTQVADAISIDKYDKNTIQRVTM